MILHARNNQLLLEVTYHARTGFRRCGTSLPQLSSGPLGRKLHQRGEILFMTKQIITRLFVAFLLFSCGCPSSQAQSKVTDSTDNGKQYVGLKYNGKNSFPPNFKRIKEYRLDSVGSNEFGIVVMQQGKTTMAWFLGRFPNQEHVKGPYVIIDVLLLPPLKKNQVSMFGTCRWNDEDQFDQDLIAIGDDSGSSEVKTIRRAWCANRETRRFESISIKNLRGVNEDRISD